jgi:hypothetical protein
VLLEVFENCYALSCVVACVYCVSQPAHADAAAISLSHIRRRSPRRAVLTKAQERDLVETQGHFNILEAAMLNECQQKSALLVYQN